MSDPMVTLQEALAKASIRNYVLQLYVTGRTPRCSRAMVNIRRICDQFLKDRCELTVIDLFDHPEQAQQEQVIAAPTLVKTFPLPLRRLIGDLSDESRVLLALDIQIQASDEA